MEDVRIRVAVPTEGEGGIDASRSAHFGHADSFTVIDVVDGVASDANVIANPPHASGGCGMTVQLLADAGVTAAIVVGMGGGPLNAMQSRGMITLFDADSPTPRAAIDAYLAGTLAPFGGDHVCRGH